MILTIAPLVQAVSRTTATRILATFATGLLIGSLTIFGVATILGNVVLATRGPLLGAIGLVILFAASLIGRLPQSAWQVPSGWVAGVSYSGALRYGVLLGIGILTTAPYGAWLGSIWLAANSGKLEGAAIGAAWYTIGRVIPIARAVAF